MKKRILSLALTLGLVMTLCPTALAAGKGLSNFQKSAAYRRYLYRCACQHLVHGKRQDRL